MDELQLGIQAAKSGDNAAARAYLVRAVQRDPNNETAWIWMAQVMDDPARRVDCLKQALRINPNNTLVQRAIQTLTAAVPSPSPTPEPEPEPELEPEAETPGAAAPAWSAASPWEVETDAEAEAGPAVESEAELVWGFTPTWGVEAEAETTEEAPPWEREPAEADEDSVAPATLWGLEPLGVGSPFAEEAPEAEPAWNFASAWGAETEAEEEVAPPPWQVESAAEEAETGWSLDAAWGTSAEADAAAPEVAPAAETESAGWNFDQLWGEEEKAEVVPPELGAGVAPAGQGAADAPAFILDDDLKRALGEGLPAAASPTASPFTVPVAEEAPEEPAAPPQRVSLLDRQRMSRFQPPPVVAAPAAFPAGGPLEEETPLEAAPAEVAQDKRGRRAKKRDAKRAAAVESVEVGPAARRGFRLFDLRTLFGIFGMIDLALIAAIVIVITTREVTKPPAERVAAQCAALDRTGYVMQPPGEVLSPTLSANTIYTSGAEYVIRETLVISPGQRLLVESGAQLIFAPGTALEVYGALYLCGTFDAPVLLTSAQQTPGSWTGVRFHGVQQDTLLSHAEIHFAGERALYLDNSAPTLANVTIANSALFPISADGNVFPDLSLNLHLRDNPFAGVEVRQGALASGKIFWQKQAIPYVIAGLLTVGADTTLDIAPGAVVKVWAGPYRVSGLWVRGALHAEGAHFTSVYDSRDAVGGNSVRESRPPQPGDWGGITFHQSSDECALSDVTVSYAGQRRGALTLRASSPKLTNVTIADSDGYPISMDGASTPGLEKLRLRDNRPNALEIRAGSVIGAGAPEWEPLLCEILPSERPTETLSLEDIMFAEMTPVGSAAAVTPTLAAGSTPQATGTPKAAKTPTAAAVVTGTAGSDVGADLPLVRVIRGDLTVEEGAALTLKPGVVVKFAPAGRLILRGALNATGGGTAEVRIVLTSLYDDDYGGNTDGLTRPGVQRAWGGVVFDQTGGDSVMQNVWVRYAPVLVENGAPRLSNNQISDNAGPGVALSPNAQPELLNNTLINNGLNAIAIMTGTVTQEQNWARLGELKDQAVRVLVGRVVVTDGVTLRIGGGTVIKADAAGQLVVSGTLRIPGQAHLPVVLTSVRDDSAGGDTDGGNIAATPGDWLGLVVGAGADVAIDYTSLRYAEVGVSLYGGVGITVTDGRLQISNGVHALWCNQPSEISTGFLIEENQANEKACPTRW